MRYKPTLILLSLIIIACSQQVKSDKVSPISEWGLLKKVYISDTIRLQKSEHQISFRFTPERTHSRYQMNIFFPSARSTYYYELGLEEQYKSFQSQVDRQFRGTNITIQNQDSVIILYVEKDQFIFNRGEKRPPSIHLVSDISLDKGKTYSIFINVPKHMIEDSELKDPVLVIGERHKVSL